jgi:hypothetical protein
VGTPKIHENFAPLLDPKELSLELPSCDRLRLTRELGAAPFVECTFKSEDIFRLPHIDEAAVLIQMDAAHKLLEDLQMNKHSNTFMVQGQSSQGTPFSYKVTVLDDMLAVEKPPHPETGTSGVEWLKPSPSGQRPAILTPIPLAPHRQGEPAHNNSTPEAFVQNPSVVLEFLKNITHPSDLRIEPEQES